MENYEQKYKESLERMKSWMKGEHPECFSEAQKAAEFIFPELKESEDLEEELNSWIRENCDDNGFFEPLELVRHFAEWQKQQMKEVLQTEYEKGRFDMKEEMMKDAVDGEICGEWRNQEEEPYELYAESYKIDNSKFRIGDKVKIIIVKEEQQ